MATLEEKVEVLEQTVAKLQHDLIKEKAVTEIQNLISRYAYLHTGRQHSACQELFAEGEPDLSIEIGPMGLYKGPDAAYKVYHLVHNAAEADPRGALFVHAMTTPVIQVADDLQTAKGLWISPGFETGVNPEGKAEAFWVWGQYGADFKCIDGVWKIWHFHFFPHFNTNFYTAWPETTPCDRMPPNPDRPPMPEEMAPNYPTSFFNEYAPDKIMPYWPVSPLPYDTYREGEQQMVGAPEGWDQSNT